VDLLRRGRGDLLRRLGEVGGDRSRALPTDASICCWWSVPVAPAIVLAFWGCASRGPSCSAAADTAAADGLALIQTIIELVSGSRCSVAAVAAAFGWASLGRRHAEVRERLPGIQLVLVWSWPRWWPAVW